MAGSNIMDSLLFFSFFKVDINNMILGQILFTLEHFQIPTLGFVCVVVNAAAGLFSLLACSSTFFVDLKDY